MSAPLPAIVLATLSSSVAAATTAWLVVRPPRRLASRVRPYTLASRTTLGAGADVRSLVRPDAVSSVGAVGRLVGPPVRALASRLSRLVDGSSEQRLELQLRQARLLCELPAHVRVSEYRLRQLGNAAVGASAALVAMLLLGGTAPVVLLAGLAGFVAGVTRWRRRVERTIDERRQRMRIELYTVNQLLAMNIRVGGGIIQAVQRVVDRGRGEVVAELADVLVAHSSGLPASEAFERMADLTPEPDAARTYRLLAAGAQWGSDLAEALRSLSEDVRDARRQALQRQATRRRAAMLVPIIAVLAPVMLLFVAAPIPSLIFGAR